MNIPENKFKDRDMLNYQTSISDHYERIQRGTSTLLPEQYIIFNMRTGTVVMKFHRDLILGRNGKNKACNFVDLSRFDALGAGVSRQHVYISRNTEGQILVGDMGSSNGTYLNEDRLLTDKLYPMDSGDVLRLGTMIIHIQFE